MKALSIKQPWAWAIINLPKKFRKDIENRTWNTKYRGEFLVHASKGFDTVGYERMCRYLKELGYTSAIPSKKEFVYGAIIGKTRLIGVTQKPQSIWFEGEYGFVLDKTMAFQESIPCKGQLNFFNVDDNIVKEQIFISKYDLNQIEFKGEKRFLSNMYKAPIKVHPCLDFYFPFFDYEDMEYPSSEHLYQALKSHDEEWNNLIISTKEPEQTKALAKKLLGSTYRIRSDWDEVKDSAMAMALYYKFSQHPDLFKKLQQIEGKIEERNCWGDQYWGTCNGVGENRLGEMLMKLKERGCEEFMRCYSDKELKRCIEKKS